MLAAPGRAASIEAAAVLSADIPQYEACFRGFNTAFNDTASLVPLDRIDPNRAKLFLAIGTRALEALLAIDALEHRTMFAMILDKEYYEGLAPGVTLNVSVESMIEVVRRIRPSALRFGVLYTDRSAQFLPEREIEGVTLLSRKVEAVTDVPVAFRKLAPEIDAFIMLADPVVARGEPARFILSEALGYGLPVAAPSEELVKLGALVAVTADYFALGVQAGKMARRILDGEKPGIESPAEYEVSLNAKTADTLGIVLSKEMAEQVTVY